jgi:hypothetical protein
MGLQSNLLSFVTAIVLGGLCLLGAISPARAEEDCQRCRQAYLYACVQERSNCTEACKGITVTDKDGCRQRCRAARCSLNPDEKCGRCPGLPFYFPAPTPPPR